MAEPSSVLLVVIGFAAGVLSGVFGIGGGVVIVPALIYLAGFTQHRATGTSLAVLSPPIGFAAAWEYYRHDNVNVPAAMIIAAAVFVGGCLGAVVANRVSGPYLRLLLESSSWCSAYTWWPGPSDGSDGSDRGVFCALRFRPLRPSSGNIIDQFR